MPNKEANVLPTLSGNASPLSYRAGGFGGKAGFS